MQREHLDTSPENQQVFEHTTFNNKSAQKAPEFPMFFPPTDFFEKGREEAQYSSIAAVAFHNLSSTTRLGAFLWLYSPRRGC